MLVVSRRLNEKIVLPSLGVTLEVVGFKGNTVKLGIAAPTDVKVLRQEIVADVPIIADLAAANSLGLTLLDDSIETQKVVTPDWTSGYSIDPRNLLPSLAPSRLRALVVEDDHQERELLAGLLHMNGCECHTAQDGLGALDYLACHARPDLLLLNLGMARCEGRRTLAQIRRDSRYRGMKVFGVSGLRPEEAGIATGPEGIDAWFPKPLNTRQLWATIRCEFRNHLAAD
jgi:carbon storage regulator CsrA